MNEPSIRRRGFLGGSLAVGAMGVTATAAAQEPAHRRRPPYDRNRRGYLIRNAYVMTMDPDIGDIAGGDVLVRDGKIVNVGRDIVARGARRIDGRGMIVLPGLVETHWHMWTSLFRSLSGDTPDRGYFPVSQGLGRVYTAEDMYLGTLLGAAEAIHGGITHVHEWCHNVHSSEYAHAGLRALKEAGLRGRYSYGKPNWSPNEQSIDLEDLERLHNEWVDYSNGGLLNLGIAWTGMAPFGNPRPEEVYRAEFDTAVRLGLPISAHLFAGAVADLAEKDLLTEGMQVIHAVGASAAEVEAMASNGMSLSLSPYTELRVGFGFPRVGDFIAADVPVGLSVDTTALSGNADMFGIMKLTQNVENGLQQSEFALPARRVLEMATIEGARSMGVGDLIGSLTPGKRADVIMVSAGDVNTSPLTDAAHMVVEAAAPANVDTVLVDGKILKWQGEVVGLNVDEIVADAAPALARLRDDAGI